MLGPAAEPLEIDEDAAVPAPLLRWGQLVPVLPLAFALIGAVVLYWPSLDSPFVADDYVYLYSVRTLSFWHYLRLAVTPGTHGYDVVFRG